MQSLAPKPHVIVVEDSALVGILLRRMLDGTFTIDLAESAADAVALIDTCAASGRPLHLILSDYELPKGDGLDVLAHARRRIPDVRRILMSSITPANLDRHIANGLVMRFLPKPIRLEDLLSL